MKKAARRLAAVSSVLASIGLTTCLIEGCAAGSAESQDDGGASSVDSGLTSDSAGDVNADTTAPSHDAGGGNDAAQDDDAADSGDPNDAGSDTNVTDAADASDANDAADSADSAPQPIFGATCPTGTVYTEPFTSDPVADGTFISLIGPSSYSASTHTLSLTAGNLNTQLWIGPRPNWTNYTVSVPIRIDSATSAGNGGLNFRMQSVPNAPANNAGQMYFAGIGTGQVVLGIENGDWTEFVGPSATFAVGTYYTLQVTVKGNAISVGVNGTSYATNYTDSTYTFGSIGLRTYAAGMTYGAITVTCN